MAEDGLILDIAGDVQADGIRSVEHCRLEIEMVGDNVFVFHFQSLEDKAMVWSRGPWHFDKNLIVLEKPVGPGVISQLKFKFS
ncbi:hypothetical protein ACOSP7_009977 [Xanthoceras sorbifolium]